MKKYIYFLEDREIWFLLAKKLKDENIAEPVMCFGDEKNFSEYREIFTDCEFFDYAKSNIGIFDSYHQYKTSGIEKIISMPDFFQFKDQSIKMMDRSDLFGGFRNIDRNDLFYSMLLYFYNTIQNNVPDFILMSGTPHTVSTYIIYNLCRYLGIKSYSFASCSILPILFIRNGISGEFIHAPNSLLDSKKLLESKIDTDIKKFLKKFQKDSFEDPIYMKIQKSRDAFSLKNIYVNFKKNISLLLYSRVEYYGFSAINNTIGIFEKILFYFLKKKIIRANILSMKEHQARDITITKDSYVYFPLHYEPERTTNPDGGDYYDQIRAIIALRGIVPKEIPIYVKEHYSQFTSSLQGYRGKGRFFYTALSKIENIHIIDMELDSVLLIQNAICTVSITGTTILESICFGIPTIIMGNSWFENFIGVTKFKNITHFNSILNNKGSIETLSSDIKKIVSEFGVFGTIGVSNTLFYKDYYCDNDLISSELQNIFNLLMSDIKVDTV